MAKKNDDFKFEIKEHLCDLTDKTDKGWKRELNIVSWNNGEDKYDIRDWNEDHTKCGKGIALSYDEFALVCQEAFDRGIC